MVWISQEITKFSSKIIGVKKMHFGVDNELFFLTRKSKVLVRALPLVIAIKYFEGFHYSKMF